MKPKLSSKEWVKDSGEHCPNCLATDAEGSFIDIDGRYAYQTMMCPECRSSWISVYRLYKYYDLQEA